MTDFVIKKSGERVLFDEEKVRNSIASAARAVHISEEKINMISDQILGEIRQWVAREDKITTSEIKEKVLSQLDVIEPEAAESWRTYDRDRDR